MQWNAIPRINLGITSYCNARCPFCERTIQLDSITPTHLPLEKIKSNINNLSIHTKHISIAGDFGDPLMHPEIDAVIDHIKDAGRFTIEIHTNAGLRNPKWFADLSKKYPDIEIVFGIDGLDHETNNRYRKNVDFDLAWSNMMEHQKYADKNKCVWQFIIFPWNLGQITEAKKIAEDKNILLYFIANDRGFDDRSKISKQMFNRIKTQYNVTAIGSYFKDKHL